MDNVDEDQKTIFKPARCAGVDATLSGPSTILRRRRLEIPQPSPFEAANGFRFVALDCVNTNVGLQHHGIKSPFWLEYAIADLAGIILGKARGPRKYSRHDFERASKSLGSAIA
ncbi:MAG: hypothetical protein JO121_21385 [Deltaproteobacteria bacterium]|nr:hypothetical protein [Deltaproteobacteria bacterium]